MGNIFYSVEDSGCSKRITDPGSRRSRTRSWSASKIEIFSTQNIVSEIKSDPGVSRAPDPGSGSARLSFYAFVKIPFFCMNNSLIAVKFPSGSNQISAMLDSDDDFVEDSSSSSRSRKTSVKKKIKPAKGTKEAKKATLKESPVVKVRMKLFVVMLALVLCHPVPNILLSYCYPSINHNTSIQLSKFGVCL
jgi:hypothetical protein